MKKILHVRIDGPGYDSTPIEEAFISLGYEYYSIPWQAIRFNNGIEFLRDTVIHQAAKLRPDIILCHIQTPGVFDFETFKRLQVYGNVVNFTFDVRSHEKSEWMYEVAPHIGHTFFACQEDVEHCSKNKIINVSCIQSSCDARMYHPKEVKMFSKDVVFVGNKYTGSNLDFPLASEREAMIEFLKGSYQDRFIAYGLGHEGGLIPPGVEAVVYQYAKIAISQNNFERSMYTSDRLWRILASGTMCLTRYFPGIETMFEKGVHLDWWEKMGELGRLVDFYLENDEIRETVASKGRQLFLERHTWKNRVAEMEKCLQIQKCY